MEAPDAWGDAAEAPLQSAPHASELPSVIITFSDPPDEAPFPEATPPSASPAFAAAEPQPEAHDGPAFLPDVTPATATPAFLPDTTPATPAPAFFADATPATDAPSPWSEPVAGPPPDDAAAEPAWNQAPMPMPGPAVAALGAWDQVTAVGPAVAWQMPPATVEVAQVEAPAEPAVDQAWFSPPPASEPVTEWKAEAPPGDWQEVKRAAPPALEAPPAADWASLRQGPDWSSAPPAGSESPAEGAWGVAPPPEAPSEWNAPAAAEEPSAWAAPAPAAPAAEWSTSALAPPAPSWHAAPAGASAMDQLESEPPEVEPGAAQELFGSVPPGASLSADESEQPEPVGPPEELASPEEFLKPVDASDDDIDLLVPVDDDEPPPPVRAQPLAAMQPVGVGALWVQGEHRVAVHTRGGRTRRGSVKDVDLGKSQFSLLPQGGGAEEPVYHAEVKAIFFMLAPGEKPQPASGGRVRVTFADGRSVEGSRDGTEAKHGFFLVPVDAARTNTRRIYVAREATTDIKDS